MLYNKLNDGQTPSVWEMYCRLHIQQNNDVKDLDNFRPIALLATFYNIWETIMDNRPNPILNIVTADTQRAYKKR